MTTIRIERNLSVRIINADVMEGLATLADCSVDCIVTDPPYGETSLEWDKVPPQWMAECRRVLKLTGSMWVFGSLRSHMAAADDGWQVAQDVVWEKHNGSNSFADRFRRVHEIAVQYYRDDAKWSEVYKRPLYTNDELDEVRKVIDRREAAGESRKRGDALDIRHVI